MEASPLLQQEFYPLPAFLILLWVIFWGIVGGVVTPRIYRRKDLDASSAMLYGAIAGAGTGPILLIYLWIKTPELRWPWIVIPSITSLVLLYWAFAVYHPGNLCVIDRTYVLTQVNNGILIGILYGIIAIGLTLIFSILGIVSFAHGQFYMIGGYVAFFAISEVMGAGFNPLVGIILAGLGTFLIGIIFELTLLRPMHLGKVERPGEYAILLTFGLAFFLEYTVLATLGANPRKLDPLFDLDTFFVVTIALTLAIIFAIGLYQLVRYVANNWFAYMRDITVGLASLILAWYMSNLATSFILTWTGLNFGSMIYPIIIAVAAVILIAVGLYLLSKFLMAIGNGRYQDTILGLACFLPALLIAMAVAVPVKSGLAFLLVSIFGDTIASLPVSRVIAAGIGLVVLAILLWFLNYTWTGKALRAVSQDKQAAAVVGINPLTMNTLAFGLGAMLAGLSGAALVQVLAWVPNIAPLASARSFVVIVLGGMGSLPGAMVGGLIIGVIESLGVGCFPDVSRALSYQQVFGMIIFAIVLLLKPTGLFGREL